MNTRPLLRSSAVALAVLCLAGCDTTVTLENGSSASVYLLAPGEAAGLVDPLGPGQRRDAEVAAGPATFTVLDDNGEVLATAECEVPAPDTQTNELGFSEPTEHIDYLIVTWTGSQITCELAPDPESAGGGTTGRLIPGGIFWPPSPK